MNKREFLGSAGALGALTLVGGPLAAPAELGAVSAVPLAAVIFDERYSDARNFAQALRGRGARPLATQLDVSRLWTNELDALAGTTAGALAGFTPYSDLLLMADWGASRSLRVRYLGMHDSRASAVLRHRLRLMAGSDGRFQGLDWHQDGWAAMLARHLADSAFEGPRKCSLSLTTRQRPGADFPGTLVSWVIA